MTLNEHDKAGLEGEDKHLVDLVTAVLVDPSVHTDTRMRVAEEITNVLRSADEDLHKRSSGRRPHPNVPAAHVDGARDLLAAVLVDPNIHTDVRMRIHREISEILGTTSAS